MGAGYAAARGGWQVVEATDEKAAQCRERPGVEDANVRQLLVDVAVLAIGPLAYAGQHSNVCQIVNGAVRGYDIRRR